MIARFFFYCFVGAFFLALTAVVVGVIIWLCRVRPNPKNALRSATDFISSSTAEIICQERAVRTKKDIDKSIRRIETWVDFIEKLAMGVSRKYPNSLEKTKRLVAAIRSAVDELVGHLRWHFENEAPQAEKRG